MILIAEDDKMNQNLLKAVFARTEYEITIVSNGQEAVEFFEKNKSIIKLIILDKDMPIMNGIDAYDIIKEINPDINIIFCSGLPDDELWERLANEKTYFLEKPLRIADLCEKVKELY